MADFRAFSSTPWKCFATDIKQLYENGAQTLFFQRLGKTRPPSVYFRQRIFLVRGDMIGLVAFDLILRMVF